MRPFGSAQGKLCVVLLVIFAAAGCGVGEIEPLVFGSVPWRGGERSTYRVTDINDNFAGSMVYEIEAGGEVVDDDGWTIRRLLDTQGDTETLTVEVRARGLRPAYSALERVENGLLQTVTADYDGAQVDLRIIGEPRLDTYERIQISSNVLDDRTLPMLMRALPLEAGYATRLDTFRPVTGNQTGVILRVRGEETVDVPAGSFEAWRVRLDFGEVEQELWVSQAAPYPVVRIEDGFTGGVFELAEFEAGG